MTDQTHRNAAAVVELLMDNNVHITGTALDTDDQAIQDGLTEFEITISLPVHNPSELRRGG